MIAAIYAKGKFFSPRNIADSPRLKHSVYTSSDGIVEIKDIVVHCLSFGDSIQKLSATASKGLKQIYVLRSANLNLSLSSLENFLTIFLDYY
jgi:hypothetical protein